MEGVTCQHCGRVFKSRMALAGHMGGVKRARNAEAFPDEGRARGPAAWFRTDQGLYVGSGVDGRPWVAYPIGAPRP